MINKSGSVSQKNILFSKWNVLKVIFLNFESVFKFKVLKVNLKFKLYVLRIVIFRGRKNMSGIFKNFNYFLKGVASYLVMKIHDCISVFCTILFMTYFFGDGFLLCWWMYIPTVGSDKRLGGRWNRILFALNFELFAFVVIFKAELDIEPFGRSLGWDEFLDFFEFDVDHSKDK